MNTTEKRLQRLERRRAVAALRIVREVIDTAHRVVGYIVRPGSELIQREPGESLAALAKRGAA